MAFLKAADLAELTPGIGHGVVMAGRAVVLYLVETGEVFALEDRCPHRDAPLAGGACEDGAAICPLHHARFDLRTGRLLSGPGGGDVPAYRCRVDGGRVDVDVG